MANEDIQGLDKFNEKYNPIKNPRLVKQYKEQGLDVDSGKYDDELTHFDYNDGQDIQIINQYLENHPNRIWTFCIEDSEPQVSSICNGLHWVNRFHYLITEEDGNGENFWEEDEIDD